MVVYAVKFENIANSQIHITCTRGWHPEAEGTDRSEEQIKTMLFCVLKVVSTSPFQEKISTVLKLPHFNLPLACAHFFLLPLEQHFLHLYLYLQTLLLSLASF